MTMWFLRCALLLLLVAQSSFLFFYNTQRRGKQSHKSRNFVKKAEEEEEAKKKKKIQHFKHIKKCTFFSLESANNLFFFFRVKNCLLRFATLVR